MRRSLLRPNGVPHPQEKLVCIAVTQLCRVVGERWSEIASRASTEGRHARPGCVENKDFNIGVHTLRMRNSVSPAQTLWH